MPDRPRSAYQGGPWLGGACIAAGLLLISLGFEWIPSAPGSVKAPPWILALTGLVVAVAGGMALANWTGHTWLTDVLALAVFVGFAMLASWVAFGPGPRSFTAEFGGSGEGVPVNDGVGRTAFAVSAAVLWALVPWVAKRGYASVTDRVRSRRRRPGA